MYRAPPSNTYVPRYRIPTQIASSCYINPGLTDKVLLQRDNGEDRPRGTLVSYRIGTPHLRNLTPLHRRPDGGYPVNTLLWKIPGINEFTNMDCRRLFPRTIVYFLGLSFHFQYRTFVHFNLDCHLILNLDFRVNSYLGHS